ncbi:MAG: cytochrome [Caulobacter sp.]|nr:cytochrome [Caulobacter sp.]
MSSIGQILRASSAIAFTALVMTGVAAAAPAKAKAPAGDAVAGATIFQGRCSACHGAGAIGTGAAPSLKGVYGRKAGAGSAAAKPFNYSPALKASGLGWDEASLNTFLTGPQKVVPGSRMFLPVANPVERQNVIAYLYTLKP